MTDHYSISDLAKEFDVTTRTIRYYEDEGLLSPLRRGQTRIYSNRDRTRLKLILRGRRLGLSLEEAGQIVNMYTPGSDNVEQLQALIDKIEQHRHQLYRQRKDIEVMLKDLSEVEKICRQAMVEKHKENQ
ncbi:MAG: MerR family DNA-binding transcriptional regulator [Pseudomonadales bacterium]|nr:MerR family DNA-binding transcriptional regulator [Pseudomonadales bacterium]